MLAKIKARLVGTISIRKNFVGRLVSVAGLSLVLSGCGFDLDARLEELNRQAEANAKAGQAFLQANGSKPGVRTTESGLQYKVIREGSGKQPQPEQKVRVHYQGTLIDGTEFDSSYSRGEAAVFPVSRLIPGWTEALLLMKEGSHWELYIPSQLAYGKKSPSTKIPPNATLVFELELLAIED